jgi:hypothetical protein
MVVSCASVFSEVAVMRMFGDPELYAHETVGVAASAASLGTQRARTLRAVNLSERRKKNRKSDAM